MQSSKSYDIRTIFEAIKGNRIDALIIGCKSVLSYTVLCKNIFGKGSPDVVMDVELLGLQTLFTRGDVTHWLNHELFQETVQSANNFAGSILGKHVEISVEAIGFSRGNTCFNFHGLIFRSPEEIREEMPEVVNDHVLREGFCKILPSSVYWNYEGNDSIRSSYRSLLPYHRPLGVPLATARASFEIGQIERILLGAERFAADAHKGLWIKAPLPEELLPPRLVPGAKRLVYIDNSNFWISGKHFSGDVKGLKGDDMYRRSDKLARMAFQDQEKYIENRPADRNMVYGKRPYYSSDNLWRVDYQRLLELVGWQKDVDPEWVIAGSVPPENAIVWDAFKDLGAKRVLTHRNVENKANSVGETLVLSMVKCIEKKYSQVHRLTDYDDIVLFGGDRCYKPVIKDILENCDNNRVFILTWGTSACYHGLKLNFSDRVFFINLEPYIDSLCYSVSLVRELSGDDDSLRRATEEHRLIRFERKRIPKSIEGIKSLITKLSRHELVPNVHYSLRRVKSFFFVIFRSQDDIARTWLNKVQEEIEKFLQELNNPVVHATNKGRFALLEMDDDEDESVDDEHDEDESGGLDDDNDDNYEDVDSHF